jgi:hypothetical protein
MNYFCAGKNFQLNFLMRLFYARFTGVFMNCAAMKKAPESLGALFS